MSAGYRAVQWTPHKKLYDLLLAGSVVVYLALFVGLGAALRPGATIETLLIRGFGTCAFLLLHVILSLGPLARLDARFLPLLYNRRHLGVTMFLMALAHGGFSLVQFHGLGELNPLVSVLVSGGSDQSLSRLPFQPLGLAALVILFLMAATSHDFWLHNLTAPTWKRLHMAVYLAYALLVLHVALGALQSERNPLLAVVLGAGIAWLVVLHLLAARREGTADRRELVASAGGEVDDGIDGWVDACAVDDIPELRARIVPIAGERVAIFRYDGKVSAVSNVCQHQNGPLGEGRIIDGCITCPWHGFQYRPEDGASPPPFTEKVPTFRVRIVDGRVLVHPVPYPAGTRVEPARTAAASAIDATTEAPA
ncbi:MAG TPA: Rieske 2Fe-2S domain-containing protein [Thermoanaerobaculia bacterium]|nr:Rieske 2Fe-2S domain-containing protein [Thermoanaerobaculia bacterium]